MSDKNFKVKNGIDAAGKLTITNTSGTDSLIEVNGAGGGQFTVTPYGGISTNAGFQSIGGPSYFGGYGGTTSVVVNVTGASGQTGDLQRWTTFSGTVLAKVDSTGSISATDLTLSGNLTVNGTTTNLNSTNLVIEDKNIIIADVATPTDTTADGAGITIKGATDKTLNWVQSTGSFTSSEPFIINSNSASSKPLIIKAANSQTADLQQWQDSTGTVLAGINSTGSFNLAAGKQLIFNNGLGTRINLGYGSAYQIGIDDYALALEADNTSNLGKIAIRPSSATYGTSYVNPIELYANGQIKQNLTVASNVGLIIKGATSQTANLQEWQSSDGTVLSNIGPNGTVTLKSIGSANIATFTNGTNGYGAGSINYAGTFSINSANMGFPYTSSGAVLAVNSTYAGSVSITARGYASQTADLQQWQNNAGTTLSKVDASGNITAPSYNLSDSKYLLRKTIKKTVDPAQNAVANNTYDLFDMNFSSSLQGTFYIQASIRGGGYGQNLTYSLPATYVMDWINQYAITNPFTNSTTWVDLTPLTFSPRHLMTNDYFKFQAKVNANQISFRIKLTGTLTVAPVFDIYIQHSEEFANSTITELNTTGTDATTSNVMPNFLSSKAGLSAIFNPITLYSNSASNIPLTIKGFASQSANLQEWQDSSANVIAKVDQFGAFTVNINSASSVPLTLKAASSQSANIQEWKNSANVVKLAIDSIGFIRFDDQTSAPTIKWGNATVWESVGGTASMRINPYGAGYIGLIVKGRASQTADLQQWQDSSGEVGMLFNMGNAGNPSTLGFSVSRAWAIKWGAEKILSTDGGSLIVTPYTTDRKVLIVKGVASQTANLQEWQNSSAAILASIGSAGGITIESGNSWLKGGTRFSGNYGGSQTVLINNDQNIIALNVKGNATQTADLQQWQNNSATVLAKVDANGNFSAISKSFDIPHPTKENMRLRYASLEGPENGVYIRGTVESNIIELPEYWTGLVHEDSITVSLTAVGSAQNIYVEKIENNKVYIGGEFTKAFFTVYGERKDIDKLTVEY